MRSVLAHRANRERDRDHTSRTRSSGCERSGDPGSECQRACALWLQNPRRIVMALCQMVVVSLVMVVFQSLPTTSFGKSDDEFPILNNANCHLRWCPGVPCFGRRFPLNVRNHQICSSSPGRWRSGNSEAISGTHFACFRFASATCASVHDSRPLLIQRVKMGNLHSLS